MGYLDSATGKYLWDYELSTPSWLSFSKEKLQPRIEKKYLILFFEVLT